MNIKNPEHEKFEYWKYTAGRTTIWKCAARTYLLCRMDEPHQASTHDSHWMHGAPSPSQEAARMASPESRMGGSRGLGAGLYGGGVKRGVRVFLDDAWCKGGSNLPLLDGSHSLNGRRRGGGSRGPDKQLKNDDWWGGCWPCFLRNDGGGEGRMPCCWKGYTMGDCRAV